MRRTSKYYELKYLVEAYVTGGGGGRWWEAIVAFNSGSVAVRYADDCSRANRGLAYRVSERRGNKWVVGPTVKRSAA